MLDNVNPPHAVIGRDDFSQKIYTCKQDFWRLQDICTILCERIVVDPKITLFRWNTDFNTRPHLIFEKMIVRFWRRRFSSSISCFIAVRDTWWTRMNQFSCRHHFSWLTLSDDFQTHTACVIYSKPQATMSGVANQPPDIVSCWPIIREVTNVLTQTPDSILFHRVLHARNADLRPEWHVSRPDLHHFLHEAKGPLRPTVSPRVRQPRDNTGLLPRFRDVCLPCHVESGPGQLHPKRQHLGSWPPVRQTHRANSPTFLTETQHIQHKMTRENYFIQTFDKTPRKSTTLCSPPSPLIVAQGSPGPPERDIFLPKQIADVFWSVRCQHDVEHLSHRKQKQKTNTCEPKLLTHHSLVATSSRKRFLLKGRWGLSVNVSHAQSDLVSCIDFFVMI